MPEMLPSLEDVALVMNLFPEVIWDRCVRGDRLLVYGWLSRPDSQADFVLLAFTPDGVGFTTSSARYSREFSERLFGHAKTHRDCERVADLFGDLVAKKVA